MNLDLKRKEFIRKNFPGTIIISILGTIGLLLIYFSGIFDVKDMNSLYECISRKGVMIIFGAFFFIVALYCWIIFFLNVIVKPKKETLYLYKNKKDEIYFLDRKGKRYDYDFNLNNIEENSYYFVLKTRNYIYEILEKTNGNWIPKEKKSYWLNCYTPMGNFENIFLLPIVYVILLLGLLSFIMANVEQKIFAAFFCIIPLYAIVYDLTYKIKLKQSNGTEFDETKFLKSYEILKNSFITIVAIIVAGFFITTFFELNDSTSKLIFSPFLGCALCTLGLVLSKMFKKQKLEKIFIKGYVIIFLILWFGMISFFTVGIVKQDGNYMYALISIPFFIFGFFVLYKYIIKWK